jgi:hypothetical protein
MKKTKKLCVCTLMMAVVGGIVFYLYKKGKLPYLLEVPPSQR